jgi:hypothetical protein
MSNAAQIGRAHCRAAARHSQSHDAQDTCRCTHADRDKETWRYVAARLDEAARGGDVLDVTVPLRMVLLLEGGCGMPPGVTPRRFPPLWSAKELDAMIDNQPMTGEQAATLKQLAKAAYGTPRLSSIQIFI